MRLWISLITLTALCLSIFIPVCLGDARQEPGAGLSSIVSLDVCSVGGDGFAAFAAGVFIHQPMTAIFIAAGYLMDFRQSGIIQISQFSSPLIRPPRA